MGHGSNVWQYFEKPVNGRSKCKICEKTYAVASNTTNLHKHLAVHKIILDRATHTRRAANQPASVVASRRQRTTVHLSKNDQEAIDRLLVAFLCRDYMPFALVESRRFQDFVRRLNPQYRIPSRQVISNTFVPDLYHDIKGKVSGFLLNAVDVCCTCDGWTSRTAEHYLGLTAHFLSAEFKMESVTLGIVKLIQQDTNGHASAITNILSEYDGLHQKVRLLVTDGAAVMKSTAMALGFPWLHCFPHRLNLVVKDSLKLPCVKNILDRVRPIVNHFHKSAKSWEALKISLKNHQLPELKLIRDVETR